MDYLERKFGRYAISNLMKIIATGMVMVYVIAFLFPDIIGMLGFSWNLILKGQVWRLVTFVFVPESRGIFAVFYFIILIFFGDIIENYYGTFKLNLYIFTGCLGTILANIVIENLLIGQEALLKFYQGGLPMTNSYLYMSLMFLVAMVAPDIEFRLYFLLPVKLKYLAIFNGVLVLWAFFSGGIVNQILIGFSLLNFLIYLLIYLSKKGGARAHRSSYDRKLNKATRAKAKKKAPVSKIIEVAFHCCEVCGKTEKDDPSLDFRYCSKCKGMHEFCNHHIKDHEHIMED